jgi:hypothetical protein
MKKLTLALVLISLTGCCPFWISDHYDPQFSCIPSSGAMTPYAVCHWVDARVRYLGDAIHDKLDYWQSPDQTWEWKAGDCEDYALLVMYVMHRDLGGWPKLACGKVPGGYHAWVEYEGEQYEAQSGAVVTDDPDYQALSYIEYGHAMWRSMNTHKTIVGGTE